MNMAAFDIRDWYRIGSYLDEALDLEPQVRASWLEKLSTTQPALAQTLHALLAERDSLRSDGFLEKSLLSSTVIEAMHETPMAGRQVGAYTIDRPLGRGGMGEVWLASRSDGRFEAKCAIKFLCALVAQPRLKERFQREAALLARLGHPHIARLFDAGATADGKQFLVLEYVDGMHIDEYCELHGLSVRARVGLFLDAVAAVAHAHRQLIIHRDLKPSNVLVTREGTVKLLDFGIAKLLKAESASTDSKTTRVEEMPITPEYAAPEQMLGDMATTATDVYQLGMLLYVLLTRRHPLPLSGSRADRIRQALNGKLPRASEFAAGELRKQLRGDLDAILAKALHGIPEQRYQTAAALHDDLVRYLRREPVSARRQTRFYAFSRLTARHRVATAATLLGVISLCGTLIFALTQGRLASSERDHALALASRNSAVTEFLGTLITEAAEADKPVTVTEMLERSEKLALADISGSPENRAAVLEMIAERIGSLGDPARAARLFENGLSLLANSPDQGLRSEINCEHASVTADLGQADAAQRTLEQELKHLDSEPRVAADCLYFLSNIAASEYQADSALRYAKLALERFRQAPAVAAGDEALMLDAVGYGYHLQGKNREADQYYREAVHKYEQLGRAASADSITVRNKWAIITNDAGAPKRALEIYDGTLRLISERLHGEAPPPYAVGNRARALESIGRYQEARTAYERQLQIAQQRQNVEGQAHAISGLASTALDVHDRTLATHYLAQFDAFVARFMPGSTQVRLWRTIAQARHDLDDGKFADAREGFAQALANSKSAISMTARLGKSEAELRAGNASAAAQDARLALEAATRGQGNLPYSDSTGLSWLALGRAEQKLGHSAEAQNAFHNAEGHLANTVDGDHPALVEARSLLSATRFEPG